MSLKKVSNFPESALSQVKKAVGAAALAAAPASAADRLGEHLAVADVIGEQQDQPGVHAQRLLLVEVALAARRAAAEEAKLFDWVMHKLSTALG